MTQCKFQEGLLLFLIIRAILFGLVIDVESAKEIRVKKDESRKWFIGNKGEIKSKGWHLISSHNLMLEYKGVSPNRYELIFICSGGC